MGRVVAQEQGAERADLTLTRGVGRAGGGGESGRTLIGGTACAQEYERTLASLRRERDTLARQARESGEAVERLQRHANPARPSSGPRTRPDRTRPDPPAARAPGPTRSYSADTVT